MARRRQTNGDDVAFGSDSFLDVMANLIGIIIILIVITALRIKQAPLVVEEKPVPDIAMSEADKEALAKDQERLKQWERDLLRIEAENLRRKEEHEKSLAAYNKALEKIESQSKAKAEEEKRYREELARRHRENDERQHLLRAYEAEAAAMVQEAAKLQQLLAQAEEEQAQTLRQNAALATEIAEREDQARQLADLLDKDIARHAAVKGTWEAIGKEMEALRQQIAAIQAKPKPTIRWVHYSSPIAKQSQMQEVHFRCMKGKIAPIHLDALLERVVDRLLHNNSTTAPQLTGVVGPIGGFRLRYEAMITGVSLTEQLNNPFLSRLQLSSWEIGGASDDLGETYGQATGTGSEMLRTLWTRQADQYAITMWVYPDSFELARSLRIYLHERGYNVALRPLPQGVPIAGSRHGTASFVQ